jgi:hypothetical protein
VICFDVLGTRKCQNFKFLTKSRFTTNRTCYTLLNFRKNPTGGVSIEMAEPIIRMNNKIIFNIYLVDLSEQTSKVTATFEITKTGIISPKAGEKCIESSPGHARSFFFRQ